MLLSSVSFSNKKSGMTDASAPSARRVKNTDIESWKRVELMIANARRGSLVFGSRALTSAPHSTYIRTAESSLDSTAKKTEGTPPTHPRIDSAIKEEKCDKYFFTFLEGKPFWIAQVNLSKEKRCDFASLGSKGFGGLGKRSFGNWNF